MKKLIYYGGVYEMFTRTTTSIHEKQILLPGRITSIKYNILSKIEDMLHTMDGLMRDHNFVSDELHIKIFHLFWYL